jgi:hypothetical protein
MIKGLYEAHLPVSNLERSAEEDFPMMSLEEWDKQNP